MGGLHLPKRVALWTFIRVYAKDSQAPVNDTMETAMMPTIERIVHAVADPATATAVGVYSDAQR